jgi:uncharacterized protein (TIGR02246 family)
MNRMTNTYLLFVCLSFFLSCPESTANDAEEIFPQLPNFVVTGEAASSDDETAIRAVMRASGQGWAEGDAAVVAEAYSNDAEWMNAFGDVRRGPEAIERYLSGLFEDDDDGMGESEQANGRMISLRYLGDDVAIFHFMTISTRAGALEGADHRQVHTTSILAKANGQWRIVHEHTSDARPRTTIKSD